MNSVNSSHFPPKAFGWFNFNSSCFFVFSLSTSIVDDMFGFFISGFGVFSCSVDPSDMGLLCPRIAANKFSAVSDKTAAVWKLSSSVLVPGVCSISSSGSDAVSDHCLGSVSGLVLHD
jgi:hypothetical protein